MRFAEMGGTDMLKRLTLTILLCSTLSGCAVIRDFFARWTPEPVVAAAPAPASAPAPEPPPVVAAAMPTPAERAAALEAVRPDPEQPITPAVQRAFDDARKAMRAGRLDEAERGFTALAKEHPELGGPHANLGLIHRQRDKLPQAVADLEAAVKASPNQALYFNQLGITYRQQGQFRKAAEAYEKAIELDPNYTSPLLNLGILHDLYLWDGKRALELYDRYLVLSPGGDAVVSKWVADLKNRKPQPITVSRKEQP